MKKEILNRKGARKLVDIPKEVIDYLNHGEIESVNLIEWLAVDHSILIKLTAPQIGISSEFAKSVCQQIKEMKKPSAMNTVKLTGALIYEYYNSKKDFQKIFKNLNAHISDSIRCYAPYLVSLNSTLSINEKIKLVKPIAADKHFGVREVAWMAIRPEIDKHLNKSITILSKWAKDKDENIRRFATEVIRPRGVWCKHIDALKEKPEIALPVLEKLKSDNSKYVQDSVGNWLNDASKSQANFVIDLCEKWLNESPTKETKYIIKKARRTIEKNKN